MRDISELKKIPLHIHLRLLSYFSKCNYPARLNYGKEIIKILSCQLNLASTFLLVWRLGIVSFYSFFSPPPETDPYPQSFLNPMHFSVRLIFVKVVPWAGHNSQALYLYTFCRNVGIITFILILSYCRIASKSTHGSFYAL